MSDIGRKISAGMRLSKFLDQIGLENTELTRTDKQGNMVLITKAEQLARTIWKHATGFTEDIQVKDEKSGKMKRMKKEYKPDIRYIQMIYDRLEGKPTSGDNTTGPKKQPKAVAVDEQVQNRIKNKVTEV